MDLLQGRDDVNGVVSLSLVHFDLANPSILICLGDHRSVSINSEAYEDYLKGRFLLDEGNVKKASVYFQQAIQKDPNYALAYAGLANSYISLGQPLLQAKAAARKALGIDASLGEAHLALARVIQLYDWDWQGAEKEYRRALELNPNNAGTHVWYGEYLQAMGRNEEAFVQVRQGMALDPLDKRKCTERLSPNWRR